MRFKLRLLDIFFPERCPYCLDIIGAEEIACDTCMKLLKEKQHPITRGAMGYRCVSSFLYGGKVRRMLLRVKFHNCTQHLRQVAVILHKDITACYGDILFDLITYVPMHPADRRRRKYNQSEILAKELGKLSGLPVVPTLVKTKRTKMQHDLSYTERRTNLRGAFALTGKEPLRDKTILLVDDIVTSGCTLGACAKELTKAHPALVCCATIADAQSVTDENAVI